MSTQPAKSEFLLLVRGTEWEKDLSPEDLQKALGRFMGWFERMSQEGIVKAGQPLEREGRTVSGRHGKIVADGPFAESKEAIGGYFLVEADSLEDAVQIARECPMVEYGVVVEVRPIALECPTVRRANELLAAANA
jgi:hypothetical protein